MEAVLLSHRAGLRTATSSAHERLDGLVSCFDFTTLTGYLALLQLHAAVLLPLESRLVAATVARDLPDWPRRARSAVLLSDLAALGQRPAPPCAVPPVTSLAAKAGALYVLEGSRLGGRLLLRRVREADKGFPAAFLGHGGGEALWPSFLEWLEKLPQDREFSAEMLASAREIFAFYEAEARGRL